MKTLYLPANATRVGGLLPNQPPNDNQPHQRSLRARWRCGWLPALAMFCGGLLLLHGGPLTMSWSTVDGGGGTSASNDGRFSLSGTAGQPDAGAMADNTGRFAVAGGFWYAETVFCGCQLSVATSGGDIVVSWPCAGNGCILEYTDELRTSPSVALWHPVSPRAAGGVYTTPLTGTQRYFRLRSP